MMPLRFLFLLNAMNGISLKIVLSLGSIFKRSQCLSIASLIRGNRGLYVTTHGIFCSGIFPYTVVMLLVFVLLSLFRYNLVFSSFQLIVCMRY